jgi:ankyrin repeat protein
VSDTTIFRYIHGYSFYFIDQKVPLNQPFLFDNGAREYILHHTIWYNPNEVEPVKRLIENGAPVNVRNFQGLSCMDIAIKRKASREIIELLT